MSNYVIIYTNGFAENMKENINWYAILSFVGDKFEHSGSSSPLPKMLLKDGVTIIQDRLWDIGYEYIKELRKQSDIASRNVRNKYLEPT